MKATRKGNSRGFIVVVIAALGCYILRFNWATLNTTNVSPAYDFEADILTSSEQQHEGFEDKRATLNSTVVTPDHDSEADSPTSSERSEDKQATLNSTIVTPDNYSEADPPTSSEQQQQHEHVEETTEQRTNGLNAEDAAAPREPVDVVSSTTEQVVSPEKQSRPSIYPDRIKAAAVRAVWDPISSGGRGHAIVENGCQEEIESAGCRDALPLDVCIRTKFKAMSSDSNVQGMLSKNCSTVLYPCQPDRMNTRECQEDKLYRNVLTDAETYDAENLLALIDQASMMTGGGGGSEQNPPQQLDYWMTAGSMIGGLVHHGRIPWDDDIDIYVRREHIDSLFRNVELLGLSVAWKSFGKIANRTGKIFNSSLPMIPGEKHSYPFVDVFPVDCSDGISCVETNSAEKFSGPIDSVFPLKRRPFGRLSMPFPVKARSILSDRYGEMFKAKCKKGAYDHRKERFTGRHNYHSVNCSEMIMPPPFVSDQYDAGVSAEANPLEEAIVHVPWKEDFPSLTVEHILDDAGNRLSSVLFKDGNEVRRSYSDGLVELNGHATTYSFPDIPPQSEKNLLPFLYEERLSFRSNRGQRTAKELNLEVLPTLDRVVVSNNYGTPDLGVGNATDSSSDRKILRVGEWNAERGGNWDVFPNFYPDADIIILNEMDWGMARSGNIDTTKAMAGYLKMNYAYGVEFMELTNGIEKEINATVGQSNLIGYHGNVVLTKWPVVESRIVRLHPLYDLLYEEKTTGQARGERRLGGRMALFALIRTPTHGDILAVSIHAHSGSKTRYLQDDAKKICKEIQKYSTTNVIMGGVIASPIPQRLVADCGFFALDKTSSQTGGKGSRLTPSWRVECPKGDPPRTARYPTRGDFILMKGSGFDIDSNKTKTSTIYTYRKHEGINGTKPIYECVSDHALLTLDVELLTEQDSKS